MTSGKGKSDFRHVACRGFLLSIHEHDRGHKNKDWNMKFGIGDCGMLIKTPIEIRKNRIIDVKMAPIF